jgi:hypothetical protein
MFPLIIRYLTRLNFQYLQLTPCIALYDTMQSLQTHIATHFLGQAYNLAAFPWRKGVVLSHCLLIQLVEFKLVIVQDS